MLSAEDCAAVAECPVLKEHTAAPLAKDPLIVILAYIFAFYPWTVFPFIMNLTNPVIPKELWVNVLKYLFSFVIPFGYVLFYIALQGRAEEYTEMSAAFIASIAGANLYLRYYSVSQGMMLYFRWVSSCLKSVARYHYYDNTDETGQDAGLGDMSYGLDKSVEDQIDSRLNGMRLTRTDFADFSGLYPFLKMSNGFLIPTKISRFVNQKNLSKLLKWTRDTYTALGSVRATVGAMVKFAVQPWKRDRTLIFWMVWFLSEYGSKWLDFGSSTSGDERPASMEWEQQISSQPWAREALRRHESPDIHPTAGDHASNDLAVARQHAFHRAMQSGLGLPWRLSKKQVELISDRGLSRFRSYISAAIDSVPPEAFRNSSLEVQERASSITEVELEWFVIFLEYAAFTEKEAQSAAHRPEETETSPRTEEVSNV